MEKPIFSLIEGEKPDNIALLSQVAHMYYDLGMLQPDIAEKLFFSRSKVSRILKKAQDLGIVEIKVNRYLSRMRNYEKKLEALPGLKKAIVMTNFDDADGETAKDDLAACAAAYVSGEIKDAYVLGITCSRTVTRVVHKLTREHTCNLQVVQTIGSTTNRDMSGELTNAIAQTYGGTAHFLNAPLYVDDVYVKEALLRDPSIMEASKLMKHCNLLLMGVGKFDASGGDMPSWSGYMTPRHREEMGRLGAVGSLCAQFFDINGNLLDCDWNQKCITIPWDDMKCADLRVAIASGKTRVPSIMGALRTGIVDVLITDTVTAACLLEAQQAK